MRIAVDHRTRYRFAEPQARIVQLLRLTPSDTQDQTVVAWRIDVDVDARLKETPDGFGNAITMLYADGPIEAIEITVTGEVLTLDGNGVINGASEPLPPALFRRTSPRTLPTGELLDFAIASAGGGDQLDQLHRLNQALHRRFELAAMGPDQGFSASAAFVLERASARDLAQMFVAAARGLEVPARYVSGYRATDSGHSCSSGHAWAEAHVDGLGWVSFDPSTGICADEHYVRVAIGFDASGAAPILGQRIGPGPEALGVDVQVDRLGGEE